MIRFLKWLGCWLFSMTCLCVVIAALSVFAGGFARGHWVHALIDGEIKTAYVAYWPGYRTCTDLYTLKTETFFSYITPYRLTPWFKATDTDLIEKCPEEWE